MLISVGETELDLAMAGGDRIQEMQERLVTTFAELEEKHALEVMQLVRQKSAYKKKLGQVGFEETERRVAESLNAQRTRYKVRYRPSSSEV